MDKKIIQKLVNGTLFDAYKYFGAHFKDGVVTFRVYAPHAKDVCVIGDFNNWDRSNHHMNKISEFGVYELKVENIDNYVKYKYQILTCDNVWIDKIDPFAFFSELRPLTSSKTFDIEGFEWEDEEYLKKRDKHFDKPLNIYEVHMGGFVRPLKNEFYSYEEIIEHLVPYVKNMGYNAIELMPLMEHPFDGSWGYLCTGYYSMTSRYGNPKQLMKFIDACHKENIAVIMDFVPVHFVKDSFALVDYDGRPLFETDDYNNKFNSWGSINFDLSKNHVRSFLISACDFYCNYYHIDGIRVDAVSNLIFYQGDKRNGIHQYGCQFIKELNEHIHKTYPQVMMIAEDSSDFPNVTRDLKDDGLGFDYKWDLGWMNDTLKYYELDPVYRKYHHNNITFSMYYYYSERFLLPFSHDEVVHGKKTIVDKMWGSYENKFAQCKNLYVYMMTHPGKKLNFMGNEFAHFREFDEKRELDWSLLSLPMHIGFNHFIRDLNLVYLNHDSLYSYDYDSEKFKWIMVNNAEQGVFAFYREGKNEVAVIVLNMTPNYYDYYELGVPYKGKYEEVINSDKQIYGGYGNYNGLPLKTGGKPLDGFKQRVGFKLASFGAMIWIHKKAKRTTKTTKKGVK
ncbi:MAG: 1,4-alpha-glucan branching protein GlgB [Bacilli bacterium]|nr:1,4-alpha-glucan branching protein GlgB [Bacilli bacterium]